MVIDFGTDRKCDFLLIRRILYRFRDIAGFLLMTHPFYPNFLVFQLDRIADVGVIASRNLKPIRRKIIFEVLQPVWVVYNTWTSQTDGQTDGQLSVTCVASRGKNDSP